MVFRDTLSKGLFGGLSSSPSLFSPVSLFIPPSLPQPWDDDKEIPVPSLLPFLYNPL